MPAITRQTLEALPIAYATQSLGMHKMHTLEDKLVVMAETGYKLVTLGFADFMTYVRAHEPSLPASTAPPEYIYEDEPDPDDSDIWAALFSYAAVLKKQVEGLGMRLEVFQPFGQFEGWQAGSHRWKWTRRRAEKRVQLSAALGVKFLQLGTNDQANADAPMNSLVEDVRFLAQLGQKHGVKISYEPWCFSPRIPSWEGCWEVCKVVDHPFIGLCIDISHIALSPDYGGYNVLDGTGYTEDLFQAELARLRALPAEKIHFFEISDVLQPKPPLLRGSAFDAYHLADPKPRVNYTWNMNCRTLPLVGKDAGDDGEEDSGVARAPELIKAVLETGYRDVFSFEVFEQQYMSLPDPTVPERYAKAGQLSKSRIFDAILQL